MQPSQVIVTRLFEVMVASGLFSLDKLLTPINKNRSYWLLLWVFFTGCHIEVCDLLGADTQSHNYTLYLQKYMYINFGDMPQDEGMQPLSQW